MGNWLDDNFFCYSSEKYTDIRSHIYGFAIKEGMSYKNCEIPDGMDLGGAVGAYVQVSREKDGTLIRSDAIGSVPVYYFENGGDWAVSNSFWLLCDEVSKNHRLSLNVDYALNLANTSLSPLSLGTLAAEIKIAPVGGAKIRKVGKATRLEALETEDAFYTVPIDSYEALDIIDGWIDKWKEIIYSLFASDEKMEIDLSGGMDTRVSFALGLASGIDLNAANVTVKSNIPVGDKLYFLDDYLVASKIAKKYGFALNQKMRIDSEKISAEDNYNRFRHLYLCCHDQAIFPNIRYKEPLYSIGGQNGENLRHYKRNMDSWLGCTNMGNLRSAAKAMVNQADAYEAFKAKSASEVETMFRTYLSSWSRSHHGIERFLHAIGNKFQLAPLSDPELYKIDTSIYEESGLLMALMVERMFPDLLEIHLANGESFGEKTVSLAKKISGMKKKEEKLCTVRAIDTASLCGFSSFAASDNDADPISLLLEHFYDGDSKLRLYAKLGFVGQKLWEDAEKKYEEGKGLKFHAEEGISPIVAIMEMLKYEYAGNKWLDRDAYDASEMELIDKLHGRMPGSLAISRYQKKLELREKLKYGRRVAVYGAGKCGTNLVKELSDDVSHEVCAVYDRDYENLVICGGVPVLSPKTIDASKFDLIIVALENADVRQQVADMLRGLGIPAERIAEKFH